MPLAAWGERGIQHYNYTTTSQWHSHGSSDVGGEGWKASGSAISHTVFDEKKGISWFSNAEIGSNLVKSNGILHFTIDAGPSTHMEIYTIALPAKPKSPGYADYDYRWAFTLTPVTQHPNGSYYDNATLQSLFNQGYRAVVIGENLVSTLVRDPPAAKDFVNRAHAIGLKVLFNVWWWELNCPDAVPGVINGCETIGKNTYLSRDKVKPWIAEYNIDGYYMDECWPASPAIYAPALADNNDLLDYYAVFKDLYATLHATGKGMDRISLINHNSGGNFMPAHDLWFDLSYKGEDWGEYQKAPTNGTLDDLLKIIWMELTQYPSNVAKDILSWVLGGRDGPANDVRGTWSICYMFGVTTPVHIPGYVEKVNYLLDNKCTLDNFHGFWQANPIAQVTGTKVYASGWSSIPGIKAIVSVNNWSEATASQNVSLTLDPVSIGISAANMIIKDAETGAVLSTGKGAIDFTVKKRDYRLLEIGNSLPTKLISRENSETLMTGSQEIVQIFTIDGKWMRSLKGMGGTSVWDIANRDENNLPPGTYLYLLRNLTGKLAILK